MVHGGTVGRGSLRTTLYAPSQGILHFVLGKKQVTETLIETDPTLSKTTMFDRNLASKSPLVTGGSQIARAAICALVFLTSGSIVYWTAARRTDAPKCYRATATIIEPFPTATGSNAADSIRSFRPDPEAIKRQVLSDASLRRIAASGRPEPSPASAPADPELIRRRLRFSSQSAAAGSCVLSIEYTDSHRDQVLRLVNELARCYADAHREAVAAMLGKADDQAAQAVQQSRQQWRQAEAQRSEFLRQPAPIQTRTETPKAAPPLAEPRWVDNPQWADLQRAHDDLVRRRQDLLQTRTPLHPQVLVLDDLIAQSEAKMASVPRRLLAGDTDAETRGHGDAAKVSPGGHAGIAEKGPAQGNQRQPALDAAVQQARVRLDQALQAQRTTQNAHGRAATVDLHPTDRCEVVAAGVPVPWRFLPLALASGLGLATAAGMFFTGLSIDPLVTSARQLQASLSSPLLGPVPIPLPAGQDDEPAVSEASSVRALNVKGAILVVVCILALAFAFAAL